MTESPSHLPPLSDQTICSACGGQERASEGYPCQMCGTFICVICNMKGVTLCKKCEGKAGGTGGA
jgi:hypothetical protein